MPHETPAIPVFFSPAYVGSSYAFDTTRKARWVADSLTSRPIRGVDLREPRPLHREQVLGAHDPAYVRAVETGAPESLAESQGFPWDGGLWPMVLASNGGVVAAALAARRGGAGGVAGSLSSGLHHARRERGAGFCTFNGLAMAAQHALGSGAGSVLVLDLDAHCGGGTHSLIRDDPRIWQLDVSVSDFDDYAPSARASLDVVTDAAGYLPRITQRLEELATGAPRFDLCLYNAGMDPYEGCDLGGLPGITREMLAERERLVFGWCRERGVPVAFVLAGGYLGARLDEAGLVDLHRLTITAAGG